ncbi:MAG TPA: hypothetical protein VGM04_06800 [Sphingomicrobium sp.]|jgi:hypothetical protein
MTGLRRAAILIASALPALAACGSGNPDALTNPNLEQNSAASNDDMMADLNAADTNVADSAVAESNTTAPPGTVDNRSTNAVDEAVNGLANLDAQEQAAEAAVVGNDTDDENDTTEPPQDNR